MGLFDKAKKGMADAAAAAQGATQFDAEQAAGAADGKIGVQNPGGPMMNPAAMGGPSTTPLAPDDPLLAPVEGISLEAYAEVGKAAQARGATTQDEVNAVAAEMGHDPEAFGRASAEWISRMGQSMVVGQQYRAHLGY